MERSEPALVPEWLRCTGSITGGGASAHHSDVLSSAHSTRSRSSRNNYDKDSPRFLERSSSSNSRRSSSSNGSSKHPYSSFTRSHRDKNREKERERLFIGDLWDNDTSDPIGTILASRVEKTALRRSQSLVSKRPGDVIPRRVEDSKIGINSQSSANGVLSGGSNLSGIQKAAFEKDFPSLGVEEKQGASGIRRVSSPVLSSPVQSLPIGNPGLLGSEKWTSALAEVPAILASNAAGSSSAQQSVAISSASSPFCVSSLNMAEALSQPPAKTRAAPQLPDKSQRLEELAIKQSRQLIPMTSMSKPLVPNSLDKSKSSKALVRTNETIVATKGAQQQPYSSQLANQSRGGQVKSDAPTSSHVGKFLVLKPGRENGVATAAREASSPTGNTKVANGLHPGAQLTPTASIQPNNAMVSGLDSKTAALSLNSKSNVDKRPSQTPAQSRSDFFNLMRRKTSAIVSSNPPNSSCAVSSPVIEKSDEVYKQCSSPINPSVMDNGNQISSYGDCHENAETTGEFSGEKNSSLNGAIYPDEEEAAFLRSLGWDENAGEDEGLTEEEINAFYQEYMKLRPSLKISAGVQLRGSMLSEHHPGNSGPALSESTSSDSDLEG